VVMNSCSPISALVHPPATRPSTCRSRSVSTSSCGVVGGVVSPVNAAMSRRVTFGASSASPAAMTRMAACRSAGGVSLSRNPLAPAVSSVDILRSERRQHQHRVADPAAVSRSAAAMRRVGASSVHQQHVGLQPQYCSTACRPSPLPTTVEVRA
jgi:hypothetical protein